MMKIDELRSMTDTELQAELLEIRNKQFRLRVQKANQNMESQHLPKMVRRQIARIKTILTEKARQNNDSN